MRWLNMGIGASGFVKIFWHHRFYIKNYLTTTICLDSLFRHLLIETKTLNLIDFSLRNFDLILNDLVLNVFENLINIIIIFSTAPKHRKSLGLLPVNQLIVKHAISQNPVYIMLSFLITQKLINLINQNNNQSIFGLLLQFLKLPLSPAERLLA